MKSLAKTQDKKYDSYVEHPRYGRYPRLTALNPNAYDPSVQLHWNAGNIHEIRRRTKQILGESLGFLNELAAMTPDVLPRIAGTAIPADLSKQNFRTIPVTHYFDIERVCRSCRRPFIFFAEEQVYWFEDLRFPLESDCVRCPACRKNERILAKSRSTYEKLATATARDRNDNLKMADCALTLVENGVFQNRVLQRVAALLKTIPESERGRERYKTLADRLKTLRSKKAPN
jgi:hypothetical protein